MTRIIIIMPANKADEANAWLVSNIGDDCRDTFVPRISKREDGPSTHAICDWMVSDADYSTIFAEFSRGWGARISEGMPFLDDPSDGKTTGCGMMEASGYKRRKRREVG